MAKKIANIGYIVVFILVVIVISLGSGIKLVDYYINDRENNTEWNVDMGSQFETDQISFFWGKMAFVNYNGLMKRVFGQTEINNVGKLKNGALYEHLQRSTEDDLKQYADGMATVSEKLAERGTSFVYVATPYAVSKFDPELPAGEYDYGNENQDRELQLLDERAVDYIDLRQCLYDDGLDQYDYMFRTDIHWNLKGGFYGFQQLQKYVQEQTNCQVDERVADESYYDIVHYDNWCVGGMGNRTGWLFSGADDLDVYIPKFDTNIEASNFGTGRFEDGIVIHPDGAGEKRRYNYPYTYDSIVSFVLGSDFYNPECPNDVKVLFVTDSFGGGIIPYMIAEFSEVRALRDPRDLTEEYIEAYDPDVVVVLYYTNKLVSGSPLFDFGL